MYNFSSQLSRRIFNAVATRIVAEFAPKVAEDGKFIFNGYGRNCTVSFDRESFELKVEGKVTYTRKLAAFSRALERRLDRAFSFAERLAESSNYTRTLADIADEAHECWSNGVEFEGEGFLSGSVAYANSGAQESEWIEVVRETVEPYAHALIEDADDAEKLIESVLRIHRDRFCWCVVTPQGEPVQEGQIDIDGDLERIRELLEECDREHAETEQAEQEDGDQEELEAAALELVQTFSAHECEEGWDYGAGIVDVDLANDEEIARFKAAAASEDEPCYVEREEDVNKVYARGFAPLSVAALALAPLMLEGAEYEDDPQGLLDARRVSVWDPCGNKHPINALFIGDYAAELRRAVQLAFDLDVEGYDWSQESLRLAYRYDDPERLTCLRSLQAGLIAINDPALRRKVGDYSREYHRLFDGIENDIEAELAQLCEMYGYDDDSDEAQALRDDAEKALKEIEDSVNDFDFT